MVINMHISVLLQESIAALNLKEDGIYVDATLGYAGHSSEILKRVRRGCLFAFDQDSEAINFSKNKLSSIGNNYEIIKSNFSTQFTLNKEVADAISEIRRIQENECKHKYKDGFCSICGREQI